MNLNGIEVHNPDNYGTHSTSHHTTASAHSNGSQNLQTNNNNSITNNNLQNASISSFQNLNAATSSVAIRTEISRFEGMHPRIFEIYDLLDKIEEKLTTTNDLTNSTIQTDLESIRENMISVEDFFVRSPEWTQPSSVLTGQIRLAVIGSMNSGKSALVHHYLTNQYQPEESREGGRFKKEIQMGNESFMMLIREEGEPISSTPFDPISASAEETLITENQVANWADAAVFVFNVTDETSFQVLSTYYERLCAEWKNMTLTIIFKFI